MHCLGLRRRFAAALPWPMEGIASLQSPFGLMDLEALDGVLDQVSECQYGNSREGVSVEAG